MVWAYVVVEGESVATIAVDVVAARNKAVVVRLSWTNVVHNPDVTARGHGRSQPYLASIELLQQHRGSLIQA